MRSGGFQGTEVQLSTKADRCTEVKHRCFCHHYTKPMLCAVKFKGKMFDNVRVFKTKIVKPRKKHQCIKCGGKIEPKQECINTTFSYDGRLISVYFCQGEKCRF